MEKGLNHHYRQLLKKIINNPESRGSYIDHFIDKHVDELYNLITVIYSESNRYSSVLEYYGAYDLIEKFRSILIEKTNNSNAEEINDFKSFFLKCVKNELNNKSRLKEFKEHNSLSFTDNPINDKGYDFSGHINQELYINSYHERLSGIIENLYKELELGNVKKCNRQLKYYRKTILGFKKFIDRNDFLFFEGLDFLFRAHFFFYQGKLNLSQKYLGEAIIRFQETKERFGKGHLLNAYNLYATHEINIGKVREGVNTFTRVMHEASREKSNDFRMIEAESRLVLSIFIGGEHYKFSNKLLAEAAEVINQQSYVLNQDFQYGQAYLNIDNDRFDNAVQILSKIEKDVTDYTAMSQIRLYTAKTELLLKSFKTKNISDIYEADEALSIAEELNSGLNNKYFKEVHGIMEGYIKDDKNLISTSLDKLSKLGFYHYKQWYERRLG